MKTGLFALGLLAIGAGCVQAEGCPPEAGVTLPEVEAMNQLVLNNDFAGLAAAIKTQMGLDLGSGFSDLQKVYAAGFEGCATVVQRTDVGGMIQSVIVFDGKVGPLYGYWLAVPKGEGHRLLSFNLNTSLDVVMAGLR